MRIIGLILAAMGFGILAFVIYTYLTNPKDEFFSPIPQNQGVGIIVVTPTKTK